MVEPFAKKTSDRRLPLCSNVLTSPLVFVSSLDKCLADCLGKHLRVDVFGAMASL